MRNRIVVTEENLPSETEKLLRRMKGNAQQLLAMIEFIEVESPEYNSCC